VRRTTVADPIETMAEALWDDHRDRSDDPPWGDRELHARFEQAYRDTARSVLASLSKHRDDIQIVVADALADHETRHMLDHWPSSCVTDAVLAYLAGGTAGDDQPAETFVDVVPSMDAFHAQVNAADRGASELEKALGRVAEVAGGERLVPALDALHDALAAGLHPFQLRALAAGLAKGWAKGERRG
jgi:hypothetical protein